MRKNKIILIIFILSMMVGGLSAQENDDFSSLENMRSSFEESFEEKTVDIRIKKAEEIPSKPQKVSIHDDNYYDDEDTSDEPWFSYDTPWSSDKNQTGKNSAFNISFGDKENWLTSILPLLLAIWVAFDAAKIGARAGQAPGFPDFGPIGWFFLTFCCWCIGFPFYVAKRSRYIEANKKNHSHTNYVVHEVKVNSTEGSAMPEKNTPALISYYMGLFSLIPCLGLLLGLPAFIAGIVGLLIQRKNPQAKGGVHAWTGIIAGAITFLLNLAIIILIIWAYNHSLDSQAKDKFYYLF